MSQLVNRHSEDVFIVSAITFTGKGELDLFSTDISMDFFLNIGVSGVTVNRLLPSRLRKKRIDELDQTAAEKIDQTLKSVRKEIKTTIPVCSYGKVK